MAAGRVCTWEVLMATNPQLPREPHSREERDQVEIAAGRRFPWGLVAAVLVIIGLVLLAWYFFR